MKILTHCFGADSLKRIHSITAALLLLLLTLPQLLLAQDPPQYGTPFGGVPDPRDVNMYQVHLRIFGPNSNIQSVTSRLDQIRDLGINVLYLMPIYPHGTDAQSTSSPYCIKDYKAVASEYGNLNDLRQLVNGAHARGMAVILDAAINGTSWDHVWRNTHPEYYTGNQLGPYSDIAELNLNHSGARSAIIDALRYWIFAANIDGYRFDYANNPPISFWQQVIGNLRGINSHNLLMFAEGERPEHFSAGFDMNFGVYWFYDGLANIAGGGSVRARTDAMNSQEYQQANGVQQVVRYTGNHDAYTNDYYGVAGGARPYLLFNNLQGTVANFLISAFMKGVPFLMSGQEVGYNQWTPWPWSDPALDINWSQNPSAKDHYTKILNFRKNSNAIRRGSLANFSNDNVCVFTKTAGSEKILVMVNMRNSQQNFTVPSAVDGNYTGVYSGITHDVISGSSWTLAPYQYFVLRFNGGGGGSSQYYIRNRWQETYLYDAGASVNYSGFSSANDHKWELEAVDGHTAIRNVATGHYMNIESLQSYVECTPVPTSYWSAQWALEDYDGHKRIRNRWQSTNYIHVENLNGTAQRGTVTAGWYSNHWALEPVSGSRTSDPSDQVTTEANFKVYPNPTTDVVQLNVSGWASSANVSVTLWDLAGKAVLQSEYTLSERGAMNQSLQLGSLKAGVYHLQVQSGKESRTLKIIKQ